MSRHPIDIVSLLLGVLVLVAGVAALTGDLGELLNRPASAIPLALGLVGLAVLTSARRTRTAAPAHGPDEIDGSGVSE